MHVIHLSILFRVALLSQGQSYDCPSVSEATLEEMGQSTIYKAQQNTAKDEPMCIILGINHKTSNIRHTQPQNLNVCCLVLQLPLPNALKPGVKSRMKM